MQRYSNPDVFFCPLYNAPGVANPKMHICDPDEDVDDILRPLSECSTPELTSSSSTSSPSSSRDNSLSPPPSSASSDTERKIQIYRQMCEKAGKSLLDFAAEVEGRRNLDGKRKQQIVQTMVIHDHGARNWPPLSGNRKRLLITANSHLVRRTLAIEHLRGWIPAMLGVYAKRPAQTGHMTVTGLEPTALAGITDESAIHASRTFMVVDSPYCREMRLYSFATPDDLKKQVCAYNPTRFETAPPTPHTYVPSLLAQPSCTFHSKTRLQPHDKKTVCPVTFAPYAYKL
ncbi:hypothetical protein DICSQDRAFT_166592 [Dichomitus squalens LYAD-421 SS1]|uniref:uncharacterized protein n=1 Tax=Dichomitus squalens (strain LYAD-421) TaxID=732165 RepID=UPI0004415EE8|nr:uncharacterized protein DICSQDRAFT_166592 [Dichomitus squalens LYAD-421 SS1]EJF65587.1 hypothetical protein DICSQDRAFT_166592 [Dichomitus squalens LYAD-421 SS1]